MSRNQSFWGCQQILLSPNQNLCAILEYICREANKIYNCAVYYARQIWFKTKRIVGRAQLCAQMKHNRHFGAMYGVPRSKCVMGSLKRSGHFES
jgi:hypothetical protein